MDGWSTNEDVDIGGLMPEVSINPSEMSEIPEMPDMMERINEPQVPKGMTGEEVAGVRNQAIELVERLTNATGSEEMEILDGATNLGLQAQTKSASQLDLLKARTHTFLEEGGPSKDIATGLRDLRLVLSEINPKEVTQPSFGVRILCAIPVLKGRYDSVARTLRRIAIHYEPTSRQVAIIETRLQEGRVLLVRDNVELRLLYQQVESQQPALLRNAYLGQVLMENMTELYENATDPIRQDRIQSAVHDISMRVQSLRTMEAVNVQYMASIDMTRQNNSRLGQSVYHTITLANNMVMVGLAIQSALIRQRRIYRAAQETRNFLGALLTSNAAAIKQHTTDIGEMYKSPTIAMEKITQAHNDLMEALQIASKLRQEGIESARKNIVSLSQMSAELQEKIGGVIGQDEAKPHSLEALERR